MSSYCEMERDTKQLRSHPNMPFNRGAGLDRNSKWNPNWSIDQNLMSFGFNMHKLNFTDAGFIDHFDDAGDTSSEANPRPLNGR